MRKHRPLRHDPKRLGAAKKLAMHGTCMYVIAGATGLSLGTVRYWLKQWKISVTESRRGTGGYGKTLIDHYRAELKTALKAGERALKTYRKLRRKAA